MPSAHLEHGGPEETLEELLNGNMRFITGESMHPHQVRMLELLSGATGKQPNKSCGVELSKRLE